MKKLFLYATLIVLVVSCSTKNENKYAGSKTPYLFQKVEYTIPPEGYFPFYIDYTGRHGSRYMGDPTEKMIAEVVQKAKNENLFTSKGQQLLEQANSFIGVNENSYGLLTDIGMQELEEIGTRILNQYSDIFRGRALKVLTTEKERTIQSAKAFISSYANIYSTTTIEQEADTAQTTLRFFDYSDEYNNYRKSNYITTVVDSIRASADNEQHTKNVLGRIFESDFIEQLNAGIALSDGSTCDSRKFVMSLYDLYTSTFSLASDVVSKYNLDFSQYFNTQELQWFDGATSCRSYMTLGPGFDVNGIQIKVAAPLLIGILKTADSVINGKQLDAYLKFGHAETTTPLSTLMEIEGANKSANSILDFYKYWNAGNIAPMAANIQLVLYKSKEADKPILAKVLLNEQEVKIPVETAIYPYYKWEDVKEYYYNKLNRLGIAIDMQPLELLKTLK